MVVTCRARRPGRSRARSRHDRVERHAPHLRRGGRTVEGTGVIPGGERRRTQSRARRARTLGVRAGPGGVGAAELPRVPRSHVRCLPGACGSLQRQPSLQAGRGRRGLRHDRTEGGDLPPVARTARRRRTGRPQHAADRRRRRIRDRAPGRQCRLRERCRVPLVGLAGSVAGRPLHGVHRRHDGLAQGGSLAPGRHLCVRHGRE